MGSPPISPKAPCHFPLFLVYISTSWSSASTIALAARARARETQIMGKPLMNCMQTRIISLFFYTLNQKKESGTHYLQGRTWPSSIMHYMHTLKYKSIQIPTFLFLLLFRKNISYIACIVWDTLLQYLTCFCEMAIRPRMIVGEGLRFGTIVVPTMIKTSHHMGLFYDYMFERAL